MDQDDDDDKEIKYRLDPQYANVRTPKDMFKFTPTLHHLDKVLCFVPARRMIVGRMIFSIAFKMVLLNNGVNYSLDLLMDIDKKAKFHQQPNTLPSQPEFSDITEFGKEGGSSDPGVNVFKNFDIRHKASEVEKGVEIPITKVRLTNKTLEIRLQYAGNGTTTVPVRGMFGPLISAISIKSEFKPPTHHKRSIFIFLGPVAAPLCLILIITGISWQRGYIGNQISRE
ncbi:probable LRR receptor-like serine/threonine-protein kinase isoform X1 [Tanacetum coccineum]